MIEVRPVLHAFGFINKNDWCGFRISPGVQSMIATAIKHAPVPFDPAVRRRLIIKSISAKQRPRRPTKTSR